MSEDIPLEKIERYKLNAETGRINWSALERFFAGGKLILVNQELDLVEVAYEFSVDNANKTQDWLAAGMVSKPTDEEAKNFHHEDSEFWSIVVRPWVLAQKITSDSP
ncbi:MAG: DUF2288 domain-containing protein [Pseudomonadota bacterium]